ncbi:MAG: oxidoreductase [Mycobacteriales bacterium]
MVGRLRRSGGGSGSGRRPVGGRGRPAGEADVEHLRSFVTSRVGVEGFIEPKTVVTEPTIVLVAADGEWTRRRVNGEGGARRLGSLLAIPVYDVAATGYPRRMREWTSRRNAGGDTGPP